MSDVNTNNWEKVEETTYDIVVDHIGRGEDFLHTLAKTLDVVGLYNAWENVGTNSRKSLRDKVEHILFLWSKNQNDGVKCKKDLVSFLETHQKAKSCVSLIRVLKEIDTNNTVDTKEIVATVNPRSDFKEDWDKLKQFLSPDIFRDSGSPGLSTFAACLNLQDYYNDEINKIWIEREDQIAKLLQKWNGVNKANLEDKPITMFINSIEAMQRKRNDTSLNNLIGRIKMMKKNGQFRMD